MPLSQTSTAALLLAGVSLPAMAQAVADQRDSDVEEMVVTSTRRTATPISEITRSVTVITAEDLDIQRGFDRSAGAVLAQSVPGFSPSTEALTNFGQQLRGRNFQTLVDGVPQGTPLRGGQRALQSVDIAAVERIEVIRGGSAIYGFGADGGLINYITKRPDEGPISVNGRASVGVSTNKLDDSAQLEGHLQLAGRSGKLDYLAGGTFVQRGNTFDANGRRRPVDPVGNQGGLDESTEYNVLTKLGYQIDESQRLEATFNFFSLRQDPDFGLRSSTVNGTLFTPPTEPEVALRGRNQDAKPGNETTNINLLYDNADLFGSAVKLQTFYQQIDTTFTLFPGFPQTEIESQKIGSRLTVNTPVPVDPLPFTLTWGLDFLADETGQFEIDGPQDAVGEQDAIAGFAQAEFPIGDMGRLTVGVRHEDVTIDVTQVQPSGALEGSATLFNVSASAFLTDRVTLFGGFSQSFSPGDILRVITDGTFADLSEVALEFVETDNYELGLRHQSALWRGELVAFFNESNNGTSFDQDLNIQTRPEEIYGVEGSLTVHATDRLDVGGTAAWLRGEVDTDNDGTFDEDLPTTRIPPEKITLFANFRPTERWQVRGQMLYSGTQSNDSTSFGGGQEIDDYVVFDLQTRLLLGPGEIQLSVTNLLDNSYLPVINQAFNSQFANVRAPGRRVSLGYQFSY